MKFTETTDLETGFAEIFDTTVGPELLRLEAGRVEKLRKGRLWVALFLGGGAALVAASLTLLGDQVGIFGAFISGLAGVIGATVSWGAQAKAWSGALEKAVMPAICDHVGDLSFSADGGGTFPIDAFRDLGMVGSYNRKTVKNLLKGTHYSTDFEIVEVHLQQKSSSGSGKNRRSSTRTVFKGLMFRISVPQPAPGRILIARDWGSIGNRLSGLFSFGKGRGMPKVEVDHAGFEDLYEVHADDPEGARAYLPEPFLESLLTIARTEGVSGAKSMVAGFNNAVFYLALSTPYGFMKLGSLSTPVTDMEADLHGIFADIELAHRIIDRLHGV